MFKRLLIALCCLWATQVHAQFNGTSGIFALNSMSFALLPSSVSLTGTAYGINASGGAGYAVNDIVTLNCQDIFVVGTKPVVTVTSVSSGRITGVSLTNPGFATKIPSTGLSGQPNGVCVFTQFSTSGSGSGAALYGAMGFISPVAQTINGATFGILPVPNGGTGDATFTANLPLIGNGTSALGQGTVSGSTTIFGTVSGTPTNGNCASWSGGNLIDAGGPCTTGGGGGTVSAGTTPQIAYYPSSGTTVASAAGITVSPSASGPSLSVIGTTSPTLNLSGGTGQNKVLFLQTSSSDRWGLFSDNTAESGSNVGSNFVINRYSDAGSFLDSPLSIVRSTGFIDITDGVSFINAATSSTPNLFYMSIGGANPVSPPDVVSPFAIAAGIGGTYADNAGGNIFQLSSWCQNSGSRPCVAIFGEGITTGASSSAWGLNTSVYTNAAGSLGNSIEADFGTLSGGGVATGILVSVGGGHATGNGLLFSQNSANSSMSNGIEFRDRDAGTQTITGNFIVSGGTSSAVTNGINFASTSFSGYAFISPGFSVDGFGNTTAPNFFMTASVTSGGTAYACFVGNQLIKQVAPC